MRYSHVAIIGAPLDLGAGRRGVDMGPSPIRVASLNAHLQALGYKVDDLGNVMADQPENSPEGPRNAKYLPQIADCCRRLASMVEGAAEAGKFPLVLGGDHSVAVGTVRRDAHLRLGGVSPFVRYGRAGSAVCAWCRHSGARRYYLSRSTPRDGDHQ